MDLALSPSCLFLKMESSAQNVQSYKGDLSISKSDQMLREPRSLIAVGVEDHTNQYLTYLKELGYAIDLRPYSKNFYDIVLANIPNVLLIDIDTLGEQAVTLTQEMKENPLTYTMPIVIVVGERNLTREIKVLEAGAEDFVAKPLPPQVLAARIHTSMRRNIRLQISNPLTGLPGATYIEEQTAKRIEEQTPLAMCYADLDNFKAFNDTYGHRRGDNVIRILATILNEGVSLYGNPGDFVGHVGGDDFIMIVNYNLIHEICDYVISSFDTLIPFQYDIEDMENEFIISTNRQGLEMRFPLMTVSIGVVTNEYRRITNYLMLTELAAEMKEYAKSISKSSPVRQSIYRIDKRTA